MDSVTNNWKNLNVLTGEYEKLIVEDEKTKEKLVVIDHEEIRISKPNLVIRLVMKTYGGKTPKFTTRIKNGEFRTLINDED